MAKKKRVEYIGELYDKMCELNETHAGSKIYININNTLVPLSPQYYVEADVTYMFRCSDDDMIATPNDIIKCIECEASDNCWHGTKFRERNSYEDVMVLVVDGIVDNVYANEPDTTYSIKNITTVGVPAETPANECFIVIEVSKYE